MGLPALPDDFDIDKQAELLESDELLDNFYGGDHNRKSPQNFVMDQVKKLNKDQRAAFERIQSSVIGGAEQRLFFIEGAGGCGNIRNFLEHFSDYN